VSQDLVIRLQDIYKIYGAGQTEVRALNGISLDIHAGDFVACMGTSGSGKSTCMNILGCLDSPTAGRYLFRDVEVGTMSHDQLAMLRRHYIGFVFQSFNLLARTSAAENVELPLIYKGVKRSLRRKLAMEALDRVGLADRFDHTPAQLSGGQQQRVAIARALVTTPTLLLADEPTGNLDSARTHEIMELLSALNTKDNITIVMVTHEPDVAMFTKRAVIFKDGKIIADGPPSEVAK
jgi:putative ABC transport system ATP-binding protein